MDTAPTSSASTSARPTARSRGATATAADEAARHRRACRSPQLVNPGRGGGAAAPALVPLLPGDARFPRRQPALPWDPTPAVRRRRARAARGAENADAARRLGQVLAVVRRRRAHRADPAVGRAAEDVPKLSPVDASAAYLGTSRAAWTRRPPATDAPLGEQDVVLTVPASFDEEARELTAARPRRRGSRAGHAARGAAGGVLRLARRARATSWRRPGRASATSILVCDVGGGTTDFSLIAVVGARRRPRARARRRRRSHPARRRQHGPRARPPAAAAPRGRAATPRHVAAPRALAPVPDRRRKRLLPGDPARRATR